MHNYNEWQVSRPGQDLSLKHLDTASTNSLISSTYDSTAES